MAYTIERRIRAGLPQVGYAPYRQVHAHSTGNSNSTADNEANYMQTKDINSGFYTHVVGNGKVIQVGEVGRGAWDVGGGWNSEGYASVELIESHSNRDEFMRDYKIYCELLKDLAKEAGIPVTVDTADLAGIKTHNYCTNNQPANGSDHVDPIPYLAKWGINLEQFRKDVTGAFSDSNNNTEQREKEEIEMFLIKGLNAKREAKHYFISNGVEVKKVETARSLKFYQGTLKLKEDTMYMSEIADEFVVKIDQETGKITK